MEVKNKKVLNEYKYLVVFDLASKISGVCLWDIEKHRPIKTNVIEVKTCDSKIKQLYDEIQLYFKTLEASGIQMSEILVCKEAMPTQVHSSASTIQTFIALAKSHAILDLFLINNNIDFYDEIGIYPISTHAYFRHLKELDGKEKVDKKMISQFVQQEYNIHCRTLDESDAVFLAQTFVDVKWNRDLDESIREVKRHKKTLKAAHAIKEQEEEIKRLNSLKI